MPRLAVAVALCTICRVNSLGYPISLSAAASLLDVVLPSPKPMLRAAYRRKAASAHPDVCNKASAREDFVRITAAYEILLQFGVSTAATPATATQSRPQPPSSAAASHTRASSWEPAASRTTTQGWQRDSERMARRVDAWRRYWQYSFQATQAASEARAKALMCDSLGLEVDRLKLEVAQALQGDVRLLDQLRARYARASVRLADLRSTAAMFESRAHMLQKLAMQEQELAQQIA